MDDDDGWMDVNIGGLYFHMFHSVLSGLSFIFNLN